MKKLWIIGAGGHGKVVADIAEKTGHYEEIAFLDDGKAAGETCGRYVIRGTLSDGLRQIDGSEFFVAVGNASVRRRITKQLKDAGAEIPVLIHPDAVIAEDCRIGEGTVVMAGTVINSGCQIGKGVIVNTGASVDHDNIIGDFSHISVGAHLAGTVRIGSGVWIGIGAVVSNNLSITDDVIIGAGAAVIRNIEESGTYVGVPAERIEMMEKHINVNYQGGVVRNKGTVISTPVFSRDDFREAM